MGRPLYVTRDFSLAAFNTLSLFCIFSVLSTICSGEFLFCPYLFSVLCASCICIGMPSLIWSYFFLWSMTLILESSFVPTICRFGFYFCLVVLLLSFCFILFFMVLNVPAYSQKWFKKSVLLMNGSIPLQYFQVLIFYLFLDLEFSDYSV